MGSNAYAIDFEFTVGQAVAVVAAGTVLEAVDDNQFNGGRGNYLEVDHGNGLISRYLHLRNTNTGPAFPPGIAPGVAVQPGVLVAYSGNTGGVAPHLHFDLKQWGSAYLPEPMSRITNFGQYGLCTGQTSPYWTSWPPYATIEGGLIRGSDDKVYIISVGQKRWITSGSVFNSCGYRWGEIMKLPDWAISMIPTGSNVSSGPPCPQTLARAFGTDPVYTLSNFTKRWVSSSTAFNGCKYDWSDIVGVSQSALNGYYTASPVNGPPCPYMRDPWYNEALIEGALIQSGDPVYVIAGGQKRHIASPAAFHACGYKLNDKIPVSSTVANLIPTGNPITGPPCPYTLIKGASSTVYVMEWQHKRSVSSSVFEACGYVSGEVVQLSDSQVNSVPTGGSLSAPPCPFTRQ